MEISFSIDMPDFVRRISDQIPKGIAQGMQKALLVIDGRAKRNLTGRFLKVQSGRLRSSLQSKVEVTTDDVIGTYGTNVFYGAIHERGAPGPWPIRPRTGKFLRFKGRDGKIVFAREVQHPGLKRRPWLGTAFRESQRDIGRVFEASIAQAISEIREQP